MCRQVEEILSGVDVQEFHLKGLMKELGACLPRSRVVILSASISFLNNTCLVCRFKCMYDVLSRCPASLYVC